MQNTTERSSRSAEGLYKFFIYFVLVLLAVIIIVPVAWVFMASIKQNAEFYGNPWALPAGFYWQNFVNAWNGAKMGEYMLNSVIVTALALVLLLVIALPAAYCLSRFRFKGRKLLNTLFMAGLFINVNYIVETPIFLHDQKRLMKVEVQFRTISMDWWASLEHKIRYKKNLPEMEYVERELYECAEISAQLDARMEKLQKIAAQATEGKDHPLSS